MYCLKTFQCIKLLNSTLNASSVVPTSEVHMATMLVLLKTTKICSLQRHAVLKNVPENQSASVNNTYAYNLIRDGHIYFQIISIMQQVILYYTN